MGLRRICSTLFVCLLAGAAAAQEVDCKAIAELESQFKQAPQPALLLQIAECKRRARDFSAAAALYAKFLTLYPNDARANEAQDALERVEREERRQRKAARPTREKTRVEPPAPAPVPAAPAPPPATAAVPPPAPQPSAGGAMLAVLEFRNHLPEGDKELESGYFADRVRAHALEGVRDLRVMTRENMLVLIPKKLEDCEGQCEVETGRRIGADLVVSGDLRKIGSSYKLDLRLHDVRSGELLGGAQPHGRTVDDLDESVAQSVTVLLQPIGTRKTAPPPASREPAAVAELEAMTKKAEPPPRPVPAPPPVTAPSPPVPAPPAKVAVAPARAVPAPSPAAPSTEERSRTWTWVSAGAAAVALGAGGVFAMQSKSTASKITGSTDSTRADIDLLRTDYTSQAHHANLAFAAGAGLAALSATFFILHF